MEIRIVVCGTLQGAQIAQGVLIQSQGFPAALVSIDHGVDPIVWDNTVTQGGKSDVAPTSSGASVWVVIGKKP